MAAGVILLLFYGFLYGWSIFRKPLMALFPMWTESNMSMVFTILMTCFSVGTLTAGFLSKRLHGRVIQLAASVLMFIGFWGASTMDPAAPGVSLVKLCLLYGGLSGFATGLGYNVCLGYIVKWYPDRAGFASSVLLVAYGTGSLIVGTLAKKLIDAVGVLSAFRIIGIVVFVVLAVGAVFIKKPGPDTVLPASKAKKEAQGSTRSYPPRVMLASGVFWVFLLWCVVKSSATMIIVSSAAPIASYFGAPAAMGLIISVTSGGGRMVYGAMHDAKGFVKTSHFNCVVMLAAGGLMLLGNYTRSAVIIIVGLLVAGLASASVSSLTSAFINWMWGPEFYQSNLSWGCLNIMLSSVIGPSVAGFLQDRAPADSYYSSTFWAMMGFCVLSCIVVLILNRMIRRYDPEKRSAGKAEN